MSVFKAIRGFLAVNWHIASAPAFSFFKRKKNRLKLLVVLIGGWVPAMCTAQITGKVLSVSDGDTFTLLDSLGNKVKVRLHGIDCPEKRQEFGVNAKMYLARIVADKQVCLDIRDTDQYGRLVAIAHVNTVTVNTALLRDGIAWHYSKYDSNLAWQALENDAKRHKKGLWALYEPIAPWEWRKRRK